MSTADSSEASTPNDQTNQAKKDLRDYLEERSELLVEWRQTEGNQLLSEKPVALDRDGEIADTSDFPSGKTDGRGNFSKRTFIRYRDTITHFLETQGVTDLQDVTPREVMGYNRVMQRRDYARTTRDIRFETLEVFFKWAEAHHMAPRGDEKVSETISQKRQDLSVSGDEKSRAGNDNHRISEERAEEILGDLAEFEYASRKMVEFLLIYHVGFRKSGLLSINCSDVKPDRGIIEVRNQPEERGIRLKRGNKGERDVNISQGVMRVVTSYIEERRTTPKDDTDALLTSWKGRINEATLYRDIAGLSKCGDCTDDDGNHLTNQNASECPESIGPHDLRRTAITVMRGKGMTWETISGRVNATPDVLRQHYDSPTHEEAAKRRKEEVLRHL
ncbi:tyrosine-type recombinase/integrase [Haloferax volcanii]|uniref:tyrosine-type recombinase/integrase n=1 Tax=Haloferax volcanii TaxID=2246 RepID=UPI0038541FFA